MGNKVIMIAFITILATASLAWALDEDNYSGNINVHVGQKYLNHDDWEPLDTQNEFGIKADFKHSLWPVSIVVGYLQSNAKKDNILVNFPNQYPGPLPFNFEGKTSEIQLGVKKIWEFPLHFQLYISGGPALVRSEMKAIYLSSFSSAIASPGEVLSDSKNAVELWLEGGMYVTLLSHINIGLAVMTTKSITKSSPEGGGEHISAFAGYHW